MSNKSPLSNAIKWFDPRFRHAGSWAYILNRITAIGLVVYLFMHLIILSKLVQGQAAYDAFVKLAHAPVVQVGELLVIAAGVYHGLNGIRISLNSFGIGVRHQKSLWFGLTGLSILIITIFALVIFS